MLKPYIDLGLFQFWGTDRVIIVKYSGELYSGKNLYLAHEGSVVEKKENSMKIKRQRF